MAAELFDSDDGPDRPVADAVGRAASHIGRTITALHRDRPGVPEQLAEAIGSLLATYGAAAGG